MCSAASSTLDWTSRILVLLSVFSVFAAVLAVLMVPGDGLSPGCQFSGRGVMVLETECQGFLGAMTLATIANVWLYALIWPALAAAMLWPPLGALGPIVVLLLLARGVLRIIDDLSLSRRRPAS